MTSLIPMAIRWDAFSAFGVPGDPTTKTQHYCGFNGYNAQLPWFQNQLSPYVVECIESQANMDLEIAVAKQAGVKCWTYNWFPPQSTMPMMAAWRLHQSSAHTNDVSWCPNVGFGGFINAQFSNTAAWHASMAAWVVLMLQTNYQKVLTNRPLVMINYDAADVANWFSGTIGNIATMITYLNGLLATAGLGSAYFVLMGSLSVMETVQGEIGSGISALGAYTMGTSANGGIGGTYSQLTTAAEALWTSYAASGSKMVPTAMCGWSPLARRDRPPSFEPQSPFDNYDSVFTAPTPAQLATHLQDAINFVEANSTVCESGVIQIYSWSECDESENPMMPSITDPPVNTDGSDPIPTSNLLIAAGAVLRTVA